MKRRTMFFVFVFAALALAMTACAGPNALQNVPAENGDVAGFWQGLIHGIIAPISFIWSLFDHNVKMYAVNNDGGWYDFGFVLGAGILSGGAGRASN